MITKVYWFAFELPHKLRSMVTGTRIFRGKNYTLQILKLWPTLLEAGVLILQDNARPHLQDVVMRVFEEYG